MFNVKTLSTLAFIVITGLFLTACEQDGLVNPEEETEPDRAMRHEVDPEPAGANVDVDSLKHISNVVSLENDSNRTEATIVIDFWPGEVHNVLYEKQDSILRHQSYSDNNTFEMETNNASGEIKISLNGNSVYIPPIKEIDDSDIIKLREIENKIDLDKIEKLVFAIHEVRMQTMFRSSDDPRVNTQLDVEEYESIDPEDLKPIAKMGDTQEIDPPPPGMGFRYSRFICCAHFQCEAFASGFGSTAGIAESAIRTEIQIRCGCGYCLGCTGYVGPDVYRIVPGLYFAEGCGRSCEECAECTL